MVIRGASLLWEGGDFFTNRRIRKTSNSVHACMSRIPHVPLTPGSAWIHVNCVSLTPRSAMTWSTSFSTVFTDPPLTNPGESTENLGGYLLIIFPLAPRPQSWKWCKFFFWSFMALSFHQVPKVTSEKVRLGGLINDCFKLITVSLFPRILLMNIILTDPSINLYSLGVISNFKRVEKSWAFELHMLGIRILGCRLVKIRCPL